MNSVTLNTMSLGKMAVIATKTLSIKMCQMASFKLTELVNSTSSPVISENATRMTILACFVSTLRLLTLNGHGDVIFMLG